MMRASFLPPLSRFLLLAAILVALAVFHIGDPPPASAQQATQLSALTVQSSTDGSNFSTVSGAEALSPAFAAATTGYRITVGNNVTHVKLTPTLANTSSSVKVGKSGGTLTTVASGSASGGIALEVGDNEITVRVTATNSSTQDYTVTVRRATSGSVWWATLTLKDTIVLGCDNTLGGYECTVTSILTDDDFPVGSATISVQGLETGSDGSLNVRFSSSNNALKALNFCVGETAIPLSGLTSSHGLSAPDGTVTAWTAGTPASLSIGTSCSLTDLSALTAESSTDGSNFAALTLSPEFAFGATGYRATVGNDTTHVRLTPTVVNSGSTVTVGKSDSLTTVVSGSASTGVALEVGDNEIIVEVTASNTAETTRNYTVNIWRVTAGVLVTNLGQEKTTGEALDTDYLTQGFTTGSHTAGYTLRSIDAPLEITGTVSAADAAKVKAELWSAVATGANEGNPDAKLHDLTVPSSISDGTLTFAAPSNTTLAANTTYHLVLYLTGALATGVEISWSGTASGNDFGQTGWSIVDEGYNSVIVQTTFFWGGATVISHVRVKGEAVQTQSSNSNLSGLTASSATGAAATFSSVTLAPAFNAGTTSYAGSVTNDQTHAKLTPTVADSNATVKVGKQGTTLATVGSGNASSAISLDEGSNAITVRVTAQDSTTKDYTVTITRQSVGGPVVSKATVSLSLARYPVPEGENAVVKATLSGRLSSDVAIPTYIRSVTAESSDYGSAPTITIPAGQLVGTGTITTSHDADGSHELFRVVLDRDSLPPSVLEGKPNSVPVRIRDDEWESAMTVSLSATPGTVQEGGDVTVTATLHIRGQKSPVPSSYVDGMTIPLRVDRGTSEEGDHGTLGSITIPRLESSATATIWTARDSDGDDETFTVSLGVLPKFRSPRAGCTTGVRVTISERAVDPGSGAAQTMGECKYPEDAPDTEPFVPRQGDDSRYFALSRLEVCYDVEASGDFAACSIATLAGYGYRALIPGSATHVKIRPTTTNSAAQVKVRKVTYQNGVRIGTAWGSLSAVPRGELSAAFTVVKTSPNTYAEVRINDGGRYTTYFLVIDPPLEESGEPDTPEEQSPQEKYADLITKIKEWRDDPCCASDKAHTDRWDRTLLTFGETVSDTTLSPMTADEAQGYVDQGWTRWVEVVAALRELEAAAQQTPPSQAPPVSSAIADVSGLEVDATQDVSLSGVFSDAVNDPLTITAASSDETIATVTVASDGSALTLTGVSEGTATITVTAQDGDGNTVSDRFAVPVARKYTGLIAQMKEWRDDPCCASDKAHTDRWDRTLLTFGETVADTSLTVMTATEAQTYADRGWTRWVEVVKALEELENQAPTVSSAIADATIVSESGTHEISLSGVFSDADNDALTITAASSDESVATVSVAADQSTLTVTAYSRGSATITVTAKDGKGGTVSDEFTVKVKAAPVVASALSDVSLEAGATQDVSLSGVFSDADGDALTITAASSDEAKATVTVAADRSKLTVAGVAQGTATITVTAQDVDGNTVSDDFAVSVPAPQQQQGTPNRAPTVSSAIADATIINESGTQTVSLSGVFSDADNDSLTVTAGSSDTAVAAVSVATDQSGMTVTAKSRGTATITVTAKDGKGGSVSDAFTVKVKAAPVVDSTLSDMSLEAGATQDVSLSGVFSDADGDTLTLSAASSDDTLVSAFLFHDTLTIAALAVGSATITVTAQDSDGNTVSDAFDVSVGQANRAPTVSSAITDATIVNESGTHEVSLSGVFSDADSDSLTIAATSGDEAVATVSVAAGYATLTVSAQARGEAEITVTADDGNGGTVSDEFTVTVKAAPVVASAISDVSGLEEGSTHEVSLSGVFSDADGDSLTITAASSDGTKATVTVAADGSALTLTGVAEGAATITVTARDTDGNTVSDDFAVSVEPKAEDDPPPDGDSPTGAPTVVSPLEDISLEGPELREIDLSGVFQDPDGDALTFSAASSNYGVATILPVEGATLTLMGTGTGTATITVTAEDSDGNEVSDAFEVTVTPASQEG